MSSDVIREPGSNGYPWSDPRFVAQILFVPLLALFAMVAWSLGQPTVFRVVQLAFGWAVVVQAGYVFARSFERGWFELFAYVLHAVAIGCASLTVTFRFERYPMDLPYDQLALAGLAGQLVIGALMLGSKPLQVRFALDYRVLTVCAVVCCSAALFKFFLYLQFVGAAGTHNAIYTEGEALRDNSPAIVRLLAAGAPLIGLLALTQPKVPWWCRSLGLLAIVLEFAIGIRSRPLFILLAAAALTQASLRMTRPRKIAIVIATILAVIGVAAIGYFREGRLMPVLEYLEVIVESLFGIFEAAVLGTGLPDAASIVINQIGPLLQPTTLGNVDTIGKLLSSTFTPAAYNDGYGYSSSALTEIEILFGPISASAIYPLAAVAVLVAAKAAITSRHALVFLYGACIAPMMFYIWRAELWQLVAPVIKALPFILVIFAFNTFARAKPHEEAVAREAAEPAE